MNQKPKIGITIGDMNGIGIEVIMKTFLDERMLKYCTPIVYGSSKAFSYHRKVLQLEQFNYQVINTVEKAKPDACNLLNCWTEEIQITLGKVSDKLGQYAYKALEAATYDLSEGKIDAIVTAPVNKNTLNTGQIHFVGHTEYLAEKFGVKENLMFLVSDTIKVGLVTNHVPVQHIANNISAALIVKKIKLMDWSLRQDFGIERPRIAVLALNPHAGDNGLIGEEEQTMITPAIEKAKASNLLVFGPYAADGFFGSGVYKKFDAILAMYHDQGLIPFKTLSFGHGVNFTAGLPIIRTSPDHGTAYNIAGKGEAAPDSFRQSVFLAIDILNHRKTFAEMTANPLKQLQILEEEK